MATLTKRIKNNLTSLDSQPLSTAALIIILFLDIFILASIFRGLDEHTRQLSSPDDFIPYSCREMAINRHWNPTNRMDNLSSIVLSYNNGYYQIEEKKKDRHPLCAPYLNLLDEIKNDRELIGVFRERTRIVNEINDLQRQIEGLKATYDTALLETIAGQQEGQSNVDLQKKNIQEKAQRQNVLRSEVEGLEQKIQGNEKVRLLWEKLEGLPESDREKLRGDLRNMYSWHSVKVLGMQLIFLLPLLAVFFIWNSASIRNSRSIQTLVSSHLLVVASIPILFRISSTIYDVIPKKLLKSVMDLLVSFKLVALWHYLVIALAVAAALFLIYIFQKKIFSREKLIDRRISKGQCQQCGRHLPLGSQACPFCGFPQFRTCGKCNRPAHVLGKFCRECGTILPR